MLFFCVQKSTERNSYLLLLVVRLPLTSRPNTITMLFHGFFIFSQKIFSEPWDLTKKKTLKEQHKSNNKFNSYFLYIFSLSTNIHSIRSSLFSTFNKYIKDVSSVNKRSLQSVQWNICRPDNTVPQYNFN